MINPFSLDGLTRDLWSVLAVVTTLVLLVWTITLHLRLRALGRRYRALLTSLTGGDLEDTLLEYLKIAREANDRSLYCQEVVDALQTSLQRPLQRQGLVRYDAFEGIGGRLSFSLALTDATGEGFVLTSVYGRDGCRVYVKSLRDGASDSTLSEEEREAVRLALTDIQYAKETS